MLTSRQTNAQLATTATLVPQSLMTQTIFAQVVTIVLKELQCPFTVLMASTQSQEPRVPPTVSSAMLDTTVCVKSTSPLCGNVLQATTAKKATKNPKNALREPTTSGLKERQLMIAKSALVEPTVIRLVSRCTKIINAHRVTIVKRTLTRLKHVLLGLSAPSKVVMNEDQLITLVVQLVESQPPVSTVLVGSSAEAEQLPFPKFAGEVLTAQLVQLEKSPALPVSTAQQCQQKKSSVLLATGARADLLNTESVQVEPIAKREVLNQLHALQVTMDLEIQTTSTWPLVARNAVEVSTQSWPRPTHVKTVLLAMYV